jgi:5-deoxy-glucuronate isomerase
VPGVELHLPAGSRAEGSDAVVVTPERAGWRYCGLRVLRLQPAETRELATDGEELAILPLSCSPVEVRVDGRTFTLAGRRSVFDRVSDWMYVPVGSELRLRSERHAELALASARADRRFEPAHVPAEAVPIEVRGAGASTRQIVNFMAPGAFDSADRLICVEVLTPDGNWSSYPPHKHDDSPGSLANNEEIYYFRVGRTGTAGTSAEGFALHRTYTTDGSIDETTVVRDGDVFLVPRGYHGPSVAAPGYPLYYLNVMAGPNAERTMAIVDDPPHAWVRETWQELEPDPRCPLIVAPGRTS